MQYSREQIKARIDVILKKQSRLETLVVGLQDDFFNEVLINYDFLIKSGKNYSQFFATFTKDYHVPLLRKMIEDLRYVVEDTGNYYLDDSTNKDVLATVKKVEESLMTDLGISSTGSILPDSYFADVVMDTSIKRTFRAGLLKFGTEKKMTAEGKAIIESYIKGDTKSMGMFESFYSKADRSGGNIFDNYQRADRLAQERFSSQLGIQAWLYVGGLIDTSRPFCSERNGKIFLADEIDSWADLSFEGKPKSGYDPRIDCGGYKCRHTLSGLGNASAMRMDNTIAENKRGVLYRL